MEAKFGDDPLGILSIKSNFSNLHNSLNPFMHNVEKWAKSCKHVWPFFNIIYERVN